jgi:hypothetical protein
MYFYFLTWAKIRIFLLPFFGNKFYNGRINTSTTCPVTGRAETFEGKRLFCI